MKVLSLEVEGFGPYLRRQTIDFAEFDDDIFVITGKTGAGKSTILDAIVFALYDAVPRYQGAAKSVRSDFCTPEDPTVVTLEFESGGERYRVRRSPEFRRPKQRGEGLTTQKAEATLWVERDGSWEALAVRPVEAGQLITDILGLSADQFLQVILLAQGRFQKFLEAKTDERRDVLRSLFGTSRFAALERHVRDVAKERSREVEAADAGLGELIARASSEAGVATPGLAERDTWLAATADALAESALEAESARISAGKNADAAATALAAAKAAADKQAKLAEARETVAALEARAHEHEADRSRLDSATRAKPVAAPMRAVERAEAEVEKATLARDAALDSARAAAMAEVAWPQASGRLAEASEESLAARVSELAGEIGALSTALELELALPRLREEAESAEAAVTAAADNRDAVQKDIDALPELAKALRAARDEAAATAARVDDLEQAHVRAEAVAQAHERALELATELAGAAQDRDEALKAHAAATEAYNDLVQRRLRSQAAHLAAELTDGEPCPVCGATEHPAPAQPSDHHVTDDEVDAARAAEAEASDLLKGAKDAVAGVESNLAVVRATAGDRDAESATAAVEAALAQLEAAHAAADERARLDEQLAGLDERESGLKESLASTSGSLDAARAARTQAMAAVESAEKAVAKSRAEYESVGARARDLERAKELVAAVAQAVGALAAATSAVSQARASLTEALDESGFDTAEAARDALLPEVDLVALRESVATHESKLAGARAVVANLSAEDLPSVAEAAATTDLEALTASAVETAQARDDAVAAETAAVARSKRFQALRAEYAEKAESSQQARAARDVALTLADSLEGNPPNDRRIRLESFVLASKLERIVAAANVRLQVMSSGQYRLEHDDDKQYRNTQAGLGLRIADSHTGQSRSTSSLSGGETFLASLSLALGLAETVTAEAGGIRLSTLFIDEGFGSLDGDTLEVAMSTLDELRSGGRTIGLISHVEAMKEQIAAKLEVERLADGSSQVVPYPTRAT
ncbi:AAA family ATPase [Demequina muriae]|uniref:Nuclease SbcCD subunit C n=1 Tax=Demequina muriae TaxID=3051664 RepID=A0ABT8GE43_9MICO|nr:AAA family ATPase [Demequina sp. EGI L300058]MDN4479684.1 AAA family ATPase [Demequina sp. EGI L300058]